MPQRAKRAIRYCLMATAMLLAHSVAGQGLDIDGIRKQRWRMIDRYQFSPGIRVEHNTNTAVTPFVAAGIGNFRNLLNAEAGVGYEILNPLPRRDKEGLNLHSISPFVAAKLNLVRWRTGSVYIGGDIAYTASFRTRHQLPNGASIDDRYISKSHPSASAKIGTKLNYWDLSIYYRYDITPAFGQKHIYESPDYDFDLLHNSIYERFRFGICLTYHITLRQL